MYVTVNVVVKWDEMQRPAPDSPRVDPLARMLYHPGLGSYGSGQTNLARDLVSYQRRQTYVRAPAKSGVGRVALSRELAKEKEVSTISKLGVEYKVLWPWCPVLLLFEPVICRHARRPLC